MNAQTLATITAILKADPTMSGADRAGILASLTRPAGAPPVNRIMRWSDAAREASLSTRTLRTLARDGVLCAVTLPGRSRSVGVTSESLRALVAPKA